MEGRSTYDIDKTHFQMERGLFLTEYGNFKAGRIDMGIFALGHLQSMYYILIFKKHQIKDKAASDKFLLGIKTLEGKLIKYHQNRKEDDKLLIYNQSYRNLIEEFDGLVKCFYEFQQGD